MSTPRFTVERAFPHEIGNFRDPGLTSPFRNTFPEEATVRNAFTRQQLSAAHVPKHGRTPSQPPKDTSPTTQRPTSRHQQYETNTATSQSQTTISTADRERSHDDFSLPTDRSSYTSHSSLGPSTATSIEGKEYLGARADSEEILRWRRDDSDWHGSIQGPVSGSDGLIDDDDESHEEEDAVLRSEMQFPPLLPTIPRQNSKSRITRNRVTAGQLADRFAKLREGWESGPPPTDSETSHSAGDDELAVSWVRYRAQREKIKNIRREMAKLRPTIRTLGRLRDLADNDFMSLVRLNATSGDPTAIPAETLARRFRRMQVRRTEFHEKETSYEHLETELDREESFFEVVEAQFFSRLYQDTQQLRPEEDNQSAPPPPASLRGISGDRPTAGNPLYTDLINAIGDRDLAKEHLSDIVHERDRILYFLDQRLKIEQVKGVEGNPNRDIRPSEKDLVLLKLTISSLSSDALRHRFGRYMKEGDLEFLRDFEGNATEARHKLQDTMREVTRLKQLCMEKKIIDSEDETTLRGGTIDLTDCPRPTDGLGHPRFNVLMSNPKHLLESEPRTAQEALRRACELPAGDPNREPLVRALTKEVGISTLLRNFTEEDKSDYINRWLLQRVVMDPLEATMLFNVFSSQLQVRDLQRWQHDVNYHWKRDRANVSPSALKGPLTSLESWQIMDEENTARVNWDIQGPSRAGSDGPEIHLRPSQLERLESFSEP